MEQTKSGYRSVRDAYAGKSVFITGGTGFLGKVIIEKLLYSCPEISKIYMLIREKRNVSAEERLKNIIKLPVFSRLQKERPQDLYKIIPVIGDISLPGLGLSPNDVETLVNEVSIVFHSAATVKFNEPLEKALKLNVIGTKRVLELCRKIRNIEAFVYVSTTYSNPHVDLIEEKIYPPMISLEEAEILANRPCISKEETLKIIGQMNNTYTFSKGLAENYVSANHGSVPTIIVRPSVVLASKDEPISGWLDTWAGAIAVLYALADGLDRTLFTHSRYKVDLIPVDYVANGVIVAASKLRSKDFFIYNLCTSSENPITYEECISKTMSFWRRKKYNTVPFPTVIFTTSRPLVKLISYVQKLCAILADCVLFLLGHQPRFAKLQSKLAEIKGIIALHTNRSWNMTAQNTCALFESLSDSDRKCFNFDPRDINWTEFLETFMQGIKTYLLR